MRVKGEGVWRRMDAAEWTRVLKVRSGGRGWGGQGSKEWGLSVQKPVHEIH